MLVLNNLFNKDLDQRSPVIGDVERVVSVDEDGNEFITWKEVDYPKLQKSLGSVNDWSLKSLLAAGIDPAFPIHTGNNTRLDGFGSLSDFEAEAAKIFEEMDKVEKEDK